MKIRHPMTLRHPVMCKDTNTIRPFSTPLLSCCRSSQILKKVPSNEESAVKQQQQRPRYKKVLFRCIYIFRERNDTEKNDHSFEWSFILFSWYNAVSFAGLFFYRKEWMIIQRMIIHSFLFCKKRMIILWMIILLNDHSFFSVKKESSFILCCIKKKCFILFCIEKNDHSFFSVKKEWSFFFEEMIIHSFLYRSSKKNLFCIEKRKIIHSFLCRSSKKNERSFKKTHHSFFSVSKPFSQKRAILSGFFPRQQRRNSSRTERFVLYFLPEDSHRFFQERVIFPRKSGVLT